MSWEKQVRGERSAGGLRPRRQISGRKTAEMIPARRRTKKGLEEGGTHLNKQTNNKQKETPQGLTLERPIWPQKPKLGARTKSCRGVGTEARTQGGRLGAGAVASSPAQRNHLPCGSGLWGGKKSLGFNSRHVLFFFPR